MSENICWQIWMVILRGDMIKHVSVWRKIKGQKESDRGEKEWKIDITSLMAATWIWRWSTGVRLKLWKMSGLKWLSATFRGRALQWGSNGTAGKGSCRRNLMENHRSVWEESGFYEGFPSFSRKESIQVKIRMEWRKRCLYIWWTLRTKIPGKTIAVLSDGILEGYKDNQISTDSVMEAVKRTRQEEKKNRYTR